MISRGKMRFMRPCNKCGVLFRPFGRTTSVCPSCKIKLECQKNKYLKMMKAEGKFYNALRWRLERGKSKDGK